MSEPDIAEFRRFHDLLTEHAPDGYTPWYFRVREGSKAPATQFGSWKTEEARLSVHQAVEWMQGGGNVGIAGTDDDILVNVDIDDEDETTPDDLKETLIARSRSRTGVHAWYFEADDEDIPNIPTDDAGEVRANWQYVVAPGSYVDTDPQAVPEQYREDAGYYTVETEAPVTSLRFDELPDVFKQQYQETQQADTDAEVEYEAPDPDGGDSRKSALFDISASDVVRKEGGNVDTDDRWSALFHGSDTDANMSVSNQGLIQCWRHNVTHNGLQALVTLSDYSRGCEAVGSAHRGSNAGDSCIKQEDGAAVWAAWKYAKRNGYIPDDDPVPYNAIKHICNQRDLCTVSELPTDSDDTLPEHAYNGALASIEDYDDLNHGRKQTDEIDDGGSGDDPTLDATAERGVSEAQAVAGGGQATQTTEADGGTAAATGGSTPLETTIEDRVRMHLQEVQDDLIQAKTARHRIAKDMIDEWSFVYPEESVRNWRTKLYVYDSDAGVYEPRGEAFVERKLEVLAGDYVTNQVRNEIVGKIERMSKTDMELSTDPERLVVGNGILDLHTGELDDYTPDEYHSTKIEVDWNPDAGDPEKIDEFLHDIVEDSDVTTLYRLIAHTLYKEYLAEQAAILIGSGSNGKSMFLSMIEEFIGSYNVAHRELQDFDDDGFAANNLQGKMANLATEIGEEEINNATTFKKLTGRDSMQARVKYEKPVKFENFATLMFATNEMPVFRQDNHAIWRRWLYVDFPYTFDADDPDAKDPKPERVLKEELFSDEEFEALLLRCQREIQRWYTGEEFFASAMDAEEVRTKMKRAAEPVYHFATTCLNATDDDDDFLEKSTVRSCYKHFAAEEDLPRIAENEFGERLMALRDLQLESKQRRVDGSRPWVYEGVELTSRGRQLLGRDEPGDDDDQQRVGDSSQAKARVLERCREMVDESEEVEPVPREGLVWACSTDMGKTTAENAIDDLLSEGKLYEPQEDFLLPT